MSFFTVSLWSQKLPSTLKMKDGTIMTGIVRMPKKIDDKIIAFTPKGGKATKVQSADIDVMTIMYANGTTEEYEYIPVFTIRSSYEGTYDKISGYAWFLVEIRDYVTLYHAWTPSESHYDAGSNSFTTTQLATTYKYCRRDGEKAATLISNASGSIGNNKFFKKCAGNYFSDDQTIIEKINNGVYTYKNIPEMVKEYNSRNAHKNLVPIQNKENK